MYFEVEAWAASRKKEREWVRRTNWPAGEVISRGTRVVPKRVR